ncbi:hypothetical protein HU200_035420 [Digitaria exilis]|uniref:Uncharacterized protein n=1 Tax=Digitaria exilis TaxID=1010633 RepID=A0A835BG12_9POAL|nr:hypothetical protein HU200_035420 [Digitaria exilis]
MAVSVAGAARLAIAVALGCAYILGPILESLDGVSPRSPVLDVAVGVVHVTLPVTYLLGVVLVYLHVMTPAAPPHVHSGVSRRLAGLACAVAFVLVVAVTLVAFCLLRAGAGGGCSPPVCGGQ